MKKQLTIILSALSMCCLISAHVDASDFSGTLVEKGSKAKAKAKIIMPCGSCHQGKAPCKKPPCHPPAPPKKCPQPVYATLVETEASEDLSGSETIVVPLNNMAPSTAQGVTFNNANDSFTLPKGVYSFHFQFTMELRTSQQEDQFRFTDIYLDLNNDSSRIPLTWNLAIDSNGVFGSSSPWASFSGSRIFTITADNTVVKMVILRNSQYLDLIGFGFPTDGNPNVNNDPVRFTLHKINDV